MTVVLPTCDRRELLAGALASALDQRDVGLEVVVVDDASTDGTSQHLARQTDARLRVLTQQARRGVAAARNRAIEAARGAWLAFLDDDDVWAPTWVTTALGVARRDEADVVYGGRLYLNEHREPIGAAFADRIDELPARLREINVLGGPSGVLARTDLVRRAGGFDASFSALADWELWLRLAELGRITVCPELLVGYTVHAGNMHVTDARRILAEHRALQAKHPAGGATFNELPLLRWMANDNHRFGHRRTAALLYLEAAIRHRSLPDLLRMAAAMFGSTEEHLLKRSPYARPYWLAPYAR